MYDNLISVIMPVYKPNPEHFKICLESVLNQTYSDLELIIIHKKNHETDHEIMEIISSKHDGRIKVIESDLGVVDARNYGIKMSNGRLVGIIDADDVCEKTRFVEQVKFMKENEVSLVGSWSYSISHDGKLIGVIEPPCNAQELRKIIMFHNPILHSSVLMKKDMLEKIGYYKSEFYPGAEDYELYLRTISMNYKVAIMPRHLISLRETQFSIMRGNRWRAARIGGIKAKKKAITSYGFTRYYDIFYFFITLCTIFVSPSMAHKLKYIFAWNKKISSR